MKRALAIAAATAVLSLTACGVPDPPKSDTQDLAGNAHAQVITVKVNGRDVTCILGGAGTWSGLSCDWSAK